MEIIKAFNFNELHTEIIIKGTYEKPLFRASDIGEVLGISSIRSVIRDFTNSEKEVLTINTNGGEQQVIFLTAKGLYKILFKSRKPIAEKFQGWVCDVVDEIRLKGIYNLETQNKVDFDKKLIKEKEIERQNILLREFGFAGALVYILRIKTYESGEYIIKIGESRRGISSRYGEHKSKYEEAILLDCFMVKRSKDFEYFLHNHPDIKFNKITDLHGHETEKELFRIGQNLSYNVLLNIIKSNINQYNEVDYAKICIENDMLKDLLTKQTNPQIEPSNNSNVNQLLQNHVILLEKIENLEKTNKEILEKLNSMQTKTTTGFEEPKPTIGPRLQKINPDTLQLIKVYETVTECMKENTKIKRPSLHKSIQENTVYNGFRWMYVDRELDPRVIRHIEETKKTRPQNTGYIAKLNSDKTQILNVYLDRKSACSSNDYKSLSALDNPVKNFTVSNGYYYMLYEKCDEYLKNVFIEKYGEPLLYKDGVGQYDNKNKLVKEFTCKYDCIRTLCISDKTLSKALDKSITYNGFYYKSLGSKLQCLSV